MDTVFKNSNRLLLNITDKMDLKKDKYIALSYLSI